MLSERPLLTIAIPTYNRADCLNILLSELTGQMVDQQVELLVSNNASPDHTSEVIDHFIRQGAKIHLIQNPENIGADANILQCYSMARGEYVWIVGDDDVIVPGGLQQVMKVLKTRDYDFVFVSTYRFSGPYVRPSKPRFTGKIVRFSSSLNFALRISVGAAFLSANIVRKDKIEEKPHLEFSEMVGSSLVQLSWTYTLLSNEPKCVLLQDRVIANKTENTGGYGTCQVFAKNIKTAVEYVFGTDNPFGLAIINRNLQHFLPWAISEDRSGKSIHNLPESTEAILKGLYKDNFRYWIFLWPVVRLPLPLAKVWMIVGKVINRIDRVVGYPIAKGASRKSITILREDIDAHLPRTGRD
jgi:abequosyltransferase